METIRVQKQDGTWLPLLCSIKEPGVIDVPGWGTWGISSTGMCFNMGGNDWRIYTLHPEDCARLCQQSLTTQ